MLSAVDGARNGNIRTSLKRRWDAITLKQIPFWPAVQPSSRCCQSGANPRFYRVRTDVFNPLSRTSVYELAPVRETLATICDFDQVNDSSHVRISVTATNVVAGDQVSISNHVATVCARLRVTAKVSEEPTNSEHILASASLPPGFPMTDIGDMPCWAAGCSTTPRSGLCSICWMRPQIDNLPIFVIELFPTRGPIPHHARKS